MNGIGTRLIGVKRVSGEQWSLAVRHLRKKGEKRRIVMLGSRHIGAM
jgi:hypothetical protein